MLSTPILGRVRQSILLGINNIIFHDSDKHYAKAFNTVQISSKGSTFTPRVAARP